MEYSKELRQVFKIIRDSGGEARFVGGAVRNFLLNKTPLEEGDIDLAVNLPVEVITKIFQEKGIKVVTNYATNIIIFRNRVFEITSTRKDENCDGRHAVMIFTPSFEEDSNRRDFTINALYMSYEGKIFDFHDGILDLKQKKVRFIGNPEFRIEEDSLRIWRFFRFSCLYADDLDEEGFLGCIKKRNKLENLSKERITTEMIKLLEGEPIKIKFILTKMIEGEILNSNEFDLNPELPLNAFERLVILNKGNFCEKFLYTSSQKKFIKFYNKVKIDLEERWKFFLLFYRTKRDIFESILRVGKSLGVKIPVDIKNLTMPNLPFSLQDIISDGFQGADISKEFERRLVEFCKNL